MVESNIECLNEYKVFVNLELRWPAVNSVKRSNSFVTRTLDKVDSAGRGLFYQGQFFAI